MGEDGAPFIRGLANPRLLPSWQLQNIPFGQKPQKWAPAKTHGGERKQNAKNKTKQKNPRLRGGEEQTELWTKVTPHLEDILQPAPQGGGNTIQCLAALFKEHCFPPPPPTPTHWPLVLLFGFCFFFSFFLFNTQTLHFQSLKNFYLKKKKTHLKLMRQAPGLAFPPGGLLSHGHAARAQPGTTGATVPQLVHPGPLCSRLGGH